MWTVIYIAPSVRIAERIQTQLADEGFLVKIKQVSGSKQQYEILVPESEIDEIQEVLNSFLHL
jgi:hypothetical protein